jgi:GT2 family glycosyltransferase
MSTVRFNLAGLPPHRVLVVIPVYGQHDLTHAVVGDLARETALVDVVVVDNGGDYSPVGSEDVLRPGTNLGWAAGTNLGTVERRRPAHDAFLWLNNDTRLSNGFVAGLVRCWEETTAGVVGPVYDCHWLHQRVRRAVPVSRYRPRHRHRPAPFVDGTAMFVPVTTVDAVGLLDAETFAPVGWGAEIDYSLRARDAGLGLMVTGLSYLNHAKSATGRAVFEGGLREYAERGMPVAMDGLERKWGPDWRREAGIDPLTQQTPALLSRFSASRFRSSRSR